MPAISANKTDSKHFLDHSRDHGFALHNRRIHIGVNASMLDHKPTGVGVFTFNLINQMHRQLMGDQRILFSVFSPVREHLDPGIQIRRIPRAVQSSEFPRSSAFSRLAWNQFMYPWVARKMDILLNPSTHGHLWTGNQVLTIHDLLSLRFPDISGHQRLYFQKILPGMIRRSAAVVTVSECTKQEVIRYFATPPEKIHVIKNGFDRRNFSPVRGDSWKIREYYGISGYLLAIGPTYPHKNFDSLIKAYALFSQAERKKLPLLIAGGRPSYVAYLRKLAADAGLSEQIYFVGYVPQELMPALYQEARMLVFPSLYEGFGIPLLEAMACGCPVVSSDASSMPEVCGDAAVYVNPSRAASIHAGIKSMLEQDALRARMSERGIARAKEFSWEKAASEMIQLLLESSGKQKKRDHV